MVKELRSSKTIAIELLSSSFAELTVFSEICLLTWLTSSSRRDALRVGRVCLDDLRGRVRTILYYLRPVVFVELCRGLEHFVCQ